MYSYIKKRTPKPIKQTLKFSYNKFRVYGKTKIFGIGRNKTGTTSLKAAMKDLGYVVGNQREAEKLLFEWAERDFNSLIKYCKSAQFFQDFPFSKPYTFMILDHEFPNSKFILTVRNSPEQWYESVVKFQTQKWGKNGNLPTKEDLQQANYIYKGRPWDSKWLSGVTTKSNLYDKQHLIDSYIQYNEIVKDYFRHRPEDLLILNVAEKGAYHNLCEFLEIEPLRDRFPWKNKSEVQRA